MMREQGVRDFLLAKRKAADRLGIVDRNALPANQEIAAALAAQQRLFGGAAHHDNLRSLREVALRAMALLECFSPRLVGPVLAGTATPHSDISLHVFAATPEEVAFMLIERGVRYRTGDRRIRLANGEHASYPSFEFEIGRGRRGGHCVPGTRPSRGAALPGQRRAHAQGAARRDRVVPAAGSRVQLAGTADTTVRIDDHFLPVRHPADGARDGEHHREHRARNAERAVDDAASRNRRSGTACAR
jgi:hypothetical protein